MRKILRIGFGGKEREDLNRFATVNAIDCAKPELGFRAIDRSLTLIIRVSGSFDASGSVLLDCVRPGKLNNNWTVPLLQSQIRRLSPLHHVTALVSISSTQAARCQNVFLK